MQDLRFLLWLITAILLAACGGSSQEEEAAKKTLDSLNQVADVSIQMDTLEKGKLYVLDDSVKIARLHQNMALLKQEELQVAQDKRALYSPALRFSSGDTNACEEVLTQLGSEIYANRKDVYTSLYIHDLDKRQPTAQEVKIYRALRKNIEQAEDEKEVVQCLSVNSFPSYIHDLEKRLFSGRSSCPDYILSVISAVPEGCTLKNFDYLVERIRSKNIPEKTLDEATESLLNFAKNGHENIGKKAGDFAYEIYTQLLIAKKYFNLMENRDYSETPGEYVVETMALYAGAECLPVLKFQLQRQVKEKLSLEGIIRFEGKSATQTLIHYLDNPGQYFNFYTLALKLYQKTKEEKLLKAIFADFEKAMDNDAEADEWNIKHFASDWILACGNTMSEKGLSYIQNKKMRDTLAHEITLNSSTGEDLAKDLYAMGLIDQPYAEDYVTKIHRQDAANIYDNGWFGYEDFLEHSGLYTYYDAEETDNMDSVVNDLLQHCKGRLQGLTFISHDGSGGSDMFTYDYTLAFFYKGKAYLCRTHGASTDQFDIALLLDVLNKILADNHISERFCSINAYEESRSIIFGENDKVKALTKKYFPDTEAIEVQ